MGANIYGKENISAVCLSLIVGGSRIIQTTSEEEALEDCLGLGVPGGGGKVQGATTTPASPAIQTMPFLSALP